MKKINRVIGKRLPERRTKRCWSSTHHRAERTIQATTFAEAIPITGLVVTKSTDREGGGNMLAVPRGAERP